MIDIKDLVEKLNIKYKGIVELSEDGQALYTDRKSLVNILETLKSEFKFAYLMDITSVDYVDHYEVVYHLMNAEAKLLAVKINLNKASSKIPSVSSIWKAADPMEREVYDLMGIVFEGHKNLKRILNPDDFIGHPLQKSFKLYTVDRF